jgi:hypothetical protein
MAGGMSYRKRRGLTEAQEIPKRRFASKITGIGENYPEGVSFFCGDTTLILFLNFD